MDIERGRTNYRLDQKMNGSDFSGSLVGTGRERVVSLGLKVLKLDEKRSIR